MLVRVFWLLFAHDRIVLAAGNHQKACTLDQILVDVTFDPGLARQSNKTMKKIATVGKKSTTISQTKEAQLCVRAKRIFSALHSLKSLALAKPRIVVACRVGLGWVSHLWFGFGFGKFPLKITIFSIFSPFGSKKISSGQKVPGSKTGWPLIYYGSKVCSGWVRAHL